MNTTELIALLKRYEFGMATGRTRDISFTIENKLISVPDIIVDSTGDGLVTEINLSIHSTSFATWVKTADRLPTKEDGCFVLTYSPGDIRPNISCWRYVAVHPDKVMYWMPILQLPEVEDDKA